MGELPAFVLSESAEFAIKTEHVYRIAGAENASVRQVVWFVPA